MKGITKNTISNPSYTDAQEWAFAHNAFIGKSGIVNYKEKLQVTKVNNNTIRIASGVYCLNGKLIMEENYIDLVHDSGSLGLKRYDLIIAEYVKDGEAAGDDFLGFRVLKGVSASSNPAIPALTNNGIIEQEMLCKIYIEDDVLTVQEMTTALIKNGVDIENLIATFNINLGYKFDLGIRGTATRNTQNSAGSISLDGTNLNNIHYTGFYYCISCVNAPVAGNGFLVVESISTADIQQTYTVKKGTTSTNIPIYRRQRVSGVWTEWILVGGSVALFGNGTSSTGAEGSTISIPLAEINKYGKLRIILFHPNDTSYRTTVDMPIDGLLTSGDKRGGGNVMSTATTTALSTAWTVLGFSTNSITINVCKYMGFTGGSTPGNPGTLYIRSVEGLPA